jgi:GT2 family glycosyltransferase
LGLKNSVHLDEIAEVRYNAMMEPIVTYRPKQIVSVDPVKEKKKIVSEVKSAEYQYSVIVPFHVFSLDRCQQNKEWLDGIVKNSKNAEIIVVDNGSCEQWRGILSQYDSIKVNSFSQSMSYASACNAGAHIATTDIFCFLNSDVEIVSKDWSLPFREALGSEDIGIVGASGRKLLTKKWVAGVVRHEDKIDYIEGWCVWMRRRIFDLLNGWDERYAPFYFEDTDLSFKVRYSLCKKLNLVGGSEQYIKHLGGMTIKHEFDKYRKKLLLNKNVFMNRWGRVFRSGIGFSDEIGIAVLIPAHVKKEYLIECLESVKSNLENGVSVYVGLDRMEFKERSRYGFARFFDLDFGNTNMTRNYLVVESIEPLIYFLDADNRLKTGVIEKMKGELLKNEADVVYCQADILDESKDKWFNNATNGLLNTYRYDPILLRERNYIDMGSLVRRSALPSGKPFDIELKALEDWDLWIRMSTNGKKFFYVEEPLYFYRIHDHNKSRDGGYWEESIAKLRMKYGNDIGFKQKKRISVVTIAKTQAEIDAKILELSGQTILADEFCTSTLPKLSDAWVEAFSKVTGDIIVVTETDAHVRGPNFIEDLISQIHHGEIVKGTEINHRLENFANIAFFSDLLKQNPITYEYSIAQDTDWYARCKANGVTIRHINGGEVFHDRGFATQKQVGRAYEYGRLHVRLIKKYGYYPLDDLIKRFKLQKRIAEESLRGIRDELKENGGQLS